MALEPCMKDIHQLPVYLSSFPIDKRKTTKMKPILLTLLALTATVLADKTCTPSFDYCAKTLIDSKGIFPAPGPASVGVHMENANKNRLHRG